jgi:hypothetical protein
LTYEEVVMSLLTDKMVCFFCDARYLNKLKDNVNQTHNN